MRFTDPRDGSLHVSDTTSDTTRDRPDAGTAAPLSDAASARIEAVCDLMLAEAREAAGLHRYDGLVQDLSGSAVAAGLARLGGAPLDDPHDEAHLQAFENGMRWHYGEYAAHRRDPLQHIAGLDLACYDREYAPEEERAAARATHLAAWPDAVDVAVGTLDLVSAPVATAVLPSARGLAEALDAVPPPAAPDVVAAARAAHGRLVEHLEAISATGDPDCAVGGTTLARALGSFEAVDVDLGELARTAEAERARLTDLLSANLDRLVPGRPAGDVIAELLSDHPDANGVIEEASALTAEVLAFTRDHDLAPWTDGECLVGPAPESRKWAMAMMAWAAPEEPDAPSWYHVTPPEPDWPAQEIEDWLAVFSRTSLPAITVHEVSPGHYAHGRALRRLPSPVRRQLIGVTFAEGWAHYVEESVIDAGFRSGDPRYVIGMCLEALVRVTRLSCSIGLHTGELTVDDAAARFASDAYLAGSAAHSEARRGTFDIAYGRYTMGKIAIRSLRDRARERWGAQYSEPRLNRALLDLGSPPIGLLDTALDRG